MTHALVAVKGLVDTVWQIVKALDVIARSHPCWHSYRERSYREVVGIGETNRSIIGK